MEIEAMIQQTNLFSSAPVSIIPHDGDVVFYEHFFSSAESDHYFHYLEKEIKWKQEPIKIFGKEVMQPRLTAWYGDADKPYRYSGITMSPYEWTPTLLAIKRRIELIAATTFTNALLNFYRNGQDSMGWHRDNEKELGPTPIIGSVSFGTARIFQFRNYKNKKEKITLSLTHGSLLIMRGKTNNYWEHQLPKNSSLASARINITFRVIY